MNDFLYKRERYRRETEGELQVVDNIVRNSRSLYRDVYQLYKQPCLLEG